MVDLDLRNQEELAGGINELYLWHGTSPAGALGPQPLARGQMGVTSMLLRSVIQRFGTAIRSQLVRDEPREHCCAVCECDAVL